VYSSDQGFYLGEHGWFDKRWIFEESLRTLEKELARLRAELKVPAEDPPETIIKPRAPMGPQKPG
jgi:hypothetical protein